MVPWLDTIAASAKKGQHCLYKTVFATLVRHLYDRRLPSAQTSTVDEVQAKGSIDYKHNDQGLAARDVVELKAVDVPIIVV